MKKTTRDTFKKILRILILIITCQQFFFLILFQNLFTMQLIKLTYHSPSGTCPSHIFVAFRQLDITRKDHLVLFLVVRRRITRRYNTFAIAQGTHTFSKLLCVPVANNVMSYPILTQDPDSGQIFSSILRFCLSKIKPLKSQKKFFFFIKI